FCTAAQSRATGRVIDFGSNSIGVSHIFSELASRRQRSFSLPGCSGAVGFARRARVTIMNLASILTSAASRDAGHVAVKLDDVELSYGRLAGATAHVAGLLREHGFSPGDRVGI